MSQPETHMRDILYALYQSPFIYSMSQQHKEMLNILTDGKQKRPEMDWNLMQGILHQFSLVSENVGKLESHNATLKNILADIIERLDKLGK